MSLQQASGLQHISNLIYATEIKDPKEFDAFCQKELQEAEQCILEHKQYVSLETFMFHVFFVLEYRIDETKLPISDRTIEQVFTIMNKTIPIFEPSFKDNESLCLTRCLSYCCLYLDSEERLLIPKSLSENTIISILQCTLTLLSVVDSKTIVFFLNLLSTPVDDDDPSSHPEWISTSFLPSIPSSPSKQYLENSQFLPMYSILLYNLNSLITHSSHRISSLALSVCEVLLLVSRRDTVIPFLPSLLSTLALSIRTDSYMTWRERSLTFLLFAQSLSCLPTVETTAVAPQSIQSVIAGWCTQLKGEEPVEVKKENHEGSIVDTQSKRVMEEVTSKVPRLLELMFETLSSDLHTNLRLSLLHSCSLLLRTCIHYFPSAFLLLLDQLVSELHSSNRLLNHLSHLLLTDITSLVHSTKALQDLLFSHIHELLFRLVGWVKHATDFSNALSIHKVINYCLLFKEDIPAILSMNGEITEEMYTLYGNLKECLKIQKITTVGIELASETTPTLFSIQYCYLTQQTASLLFQLLQILGQFLPCLENEVILWVLADCMKETDKEASLLGVHYLHYHTSLTPSLREMISTLFDSIQFAGNSHNLSMDQTALNLYLLTQLLIRTQSVDEFRPILLSSLFYNRVLLQKHGMVLSCLDQVKHYYQYHSLSKLIVNNYDYLFDSLLMKIHFLLTLQNSSLLTQYIQILTSVWEDLVRSEVRLLPYIRDTIQISVELFHKQQNIAVDLLVPITMYLVRACHDLPSMQAVYVDSSVDGYLDWYFQEKLLNRLSSLQSVQDPFLKMRNGVNEEVMKEGGGDEVIQGTEEVGNVTKEESEAVEMKKEICEDTEHLKKEERDEPNSCKEIPDQVTEEPCENPTENVDDALEEQEKEELSLLKTIVNTIKYALNYSSDIHIIQSIIQIITIIMKLPFGEDQFNLLNSIRPFCYSLLNHPNQIYYKDLIAIYLRYIDLDNHATISYLQDDCWPSIKKALIGCIHATNSEFDVIHNREYALELEKSLVLSLCTIYKNSFVFEPIAYELCEVIDMRAISSLPDYYMELLRLICIYNNDAIEQYVYNTQDGSLPISHQHLSCIRFKQSQAERKHCSNSIFIESIQTCKLLIQ